MLLFFGAQTILLAVIAVVAILGIILVIMSKALKGMNKNVITRTIGIALFSIVGIVIGFMVLPFGTNAEEVLEGYDSTRTYARDAKSLSIAVDTYIEKADSFIEGKKKGDEIVNNPSKVDGLGSYNTLLSNEEYEAFTASLSIKQNDYHGVTWTSEGGKALNRDISCAAFFDKVENYLTTTNTGSGGEISIWNAMQCAAFANWYINEVVYKADSAATAVNDGAIRPTSTYREGLIWVCNPNSSGYSFTGNVTDGKEFFKGVVPGTFVRNEGNIHSYIILGADDKEIIIYDCNTGSNVYGHDAIRLHRLTWEQFFSSDFTHYTGNIYGVIAPPGTTLPAGLLLPEAEECGTIQ